MARVQGLTALSGELRCGHALDGRSEAVTAEPASYEAALVVLGPFPAAQAGRRLVLRDLVATDRVLTVELPPQGAHETLWVEARVDTGTAHARPVRRPR